MTQRATVTKISPIEAGRYKGEASTASGLITELQDLMDQAKRFTYPVKITIDGIGSTLDYKALLMGYWFPAMAQQFTDRGRATTASEMHDLACHMFFGYTPRRLIGKTQIEPALITLTYPEQKTRGELYDFCRKLEEWCQSVGVTLPEKESQYAQDKAKQER